MGGWDDGRLGDCETGRLGGWGLGGWDGGILGGLENGKL